MGDFAADGPPDAPNRAPGAAAGRVRRRQRAAGSRLAALPARTALPAALARIRPPRRGETGRMPPAALPEKPCATCGRTMVWRAKWAKNWDSVRYCSAGCRRGLDATDRALEAAILALLGQRAAVRRDGALIAVRFGRRADGCAEVHQRLIELAGRFRRDELLGERPQHSLAGRRTRVVAKSEQTAVQPQRVRFEDRSRTIKRERHDRSGGVSADARQRQQFLD